jgi:hypothetical protein
MTAVRLLVDYQCNEFRAERGTVVELQEPTARVLLADGNAEPVRFRLSLANIAPTEAPAAGRADNHEAPPDAA